MCVQVIVNQACVAHLWLPSPTRVSKAYYMYNIQLLIGQYLVGEEERHREKLMLRSIA